MPATITQLLTNDTAQDGDKASSSSRWYVAGEADKGAALTALLLGVPQWASGLILGSVELESLVPDSWLATVEYREPKDGEKEEGPPDPKITWDSTGSTQHITQSISTSGRYGTNASTEMKGAIGFDGETVQGTDVIVPAFVFQETHYLEHAVMTQAYAMQIAELTGSVNNAAFRGFAAGEVLFQGATASRQGTKADDLWEVSFRFAAQRNKTGLTVGTITGIAKKGWEYLWIQYADKADDTLKVLVKEPVAVYVEKVYPDGNFTLLGIG